jgi:hypothetical protein
MKKALVAVALAAFAHAAYAATAGGSHDLSSTGRRRNATSTLSACQYCHAPHNVNVAVTGAPLWNRNASTATFQYYTSNTVSATPTALNANSMTCMSCHDGVSDMGAVYTGSHGFGGTVTTIATFAGGAAAYANVTTDMRNDHPVSINYVAAANSLDTVANVRAAGLRLYGASPTIECGSCHDPHGTTVVGGGSDGAAGGEAFLRVAKTAICTSCHLK